MSDIQDLQFPTDWKNDLQKDFDAVFTNAALHWCKRSPRGVVESASRALKKGGRFVVEMGGFTNVVGQFFFNHCSFLHVINYYVRCKNGQL